MSESLATLFTVAVNFQAAVSCRVHAIVSKLCRVFSCFFETLPIPRLLYFETGYLNVNNIIKCIIQYRVYFRIVPKGVGGGGGGNGHGLNLKGGGEIVYLLGKNYNIPLGLEYSQSKGGTRATPLAPLK